MKNQKGVIYLLHFSGKVADHAQHYLGWALDPEKRLKEHRAKLVLAAKAKGLTMEIVRTWEGTRDQERRLKNLKNPRMLCPQCNPTNQRGIRI